MSFKAAVLAEAILFGRLLCIHKVTWYGTTNHEYNICSDCTMSEQLTKCCIHPGNFYSQTTQFNCQLKLTVKLT